LFECDALFLDTFFEIVEGDGVCCHWIVGIILFGPGPVIDEDSPSYNPFLCPFYQISQTRGKTDRARNGRVRDGIGEQVGRVPWMPLTVEPG
jgi:hypothetical protein